MNKDERNYIVLEGDCIDYDIGIGNIIIEAPTDIFYEIQCGGALTDHAYIEGYLISWQTKKDLIKRIRDLIINLNQCELLGCYMAHYDHEEGCGTFYHDEVGLYKIDVAREVDIYSADKIDKFLEEVENITSSYYGENIFTLKVNRDPTLLFEMREGLIPVLITFVKNYGNFTTLPHAIKQNKNFVTTKTLKGYLYLGNCD